MVDSKLTSSCSVVDFNLFMQSIVRKAVYFLMSSPSLNH